jgi:hypothetical protein
MKLSKNKIQDDSGDGFREGASLDSIIFPGDLVEVTFLDQWGTLSNLLGNNSSRSRVRVGQIGIVINVAEGLSDCFLVVLEGRRVYLGEREIKVIQCGEGTPSLEQREKLLPHVVTRRQNKFFKERVAKVINEPESESDKINLESSSIEKISEILLITSPLEKK